MGSVVVHDVSQPMVSQKWALECGTHPFNRKFVRAHMHGHPVHAPGSIAMLMQMAALEQSFVSWDDRIG